MDPKKIALLAIPLLALLALAAALKQMMTVMMTTAATLLKTAAVLVLVIGFGGKILNWFTLVVTFVTFAAAAPSVSKQDLCRICDCDGNGVLDCTDKDLRGFSKEFMGASFYGFNGLSFKDALGIDPAWFACPKMPTIRVMNLEGTGLACGEIKIGRPCLNRVSLTCSTAF